MKVKHLNIRPKTTEESNHGQEDQGGRREGEGGGKSVLAHNDLSGACLCVW